MGYLLWVNDQDRWERGELPDGPPVIVHSTGGPSGGITLAPLTDDEIRLDGTALALIVPSARSGRVRHIHLALMTETFRNADPLPLAELAVLQDRDSLVYHHRDGTTSRLFFDDYRRPEAAPHTGHPLDCPFCRQPVTAGQLAVVCPGCATVFHHAEADGCWLASGTCPQCGGPTAFDLSPTWIPGGFNESAAEFATDEEDA